VLWKSLGQQAQRLARCHARLPLLVIQTSVYLGWRTSRRTASFAPRSALTRKLCCLARCGSQEHCTLRMTAGSCAGWARVTCTTSRAAAQRTSSLDPPAAAALECDQRPDAHHACGTLAHGGRGGVPCSRTSCAAHAEPLMSPLQRVVNCCKPTPFAPSISCSSFCSRLLFPWSSLAPVIVAGSWSSAHMPAKHARHASCLPPLHRA
jgi:hypothetical protein